MPPAVATVRPTGPPASRALSDYLELTKPRVTLMVVITTAIGFYLGSGATLDLMLLFNTLIGTGSEHLTGAAPGRRDKNRDSERRQQGV